MNISNATSLVTCSGPYWWKVNTGSSNGWVPSGNKILPGPMLTKMTPYDVTRRQIVKKTKLFNGCLMTLPSNGITTEARFSILCISILVNVVFCGVEFPLKPQTYVFLQIEVFRSSKWIKAVENAGLWCITMSWFVFCPLDLSHAFQLLNIPKRVCDFDRIVSWLNWYLVDDPNRSYVDGLNETRIGHVYPNDNYQCHQCQ